jgi:site-specific DNA-methyltransferase (adenine-specific)
MDIVYLDDCLTRMGQLPAESVDLVYADPPYGSNLKARAYRHSVDMAYSDKWSSLGEYAAWMRPRVEQCRRLLKPAGSMYLQCDWHATHWLRMVMDDVFGAAMFRNEIIWCVCGGYTKRGFRKAHDTILFYSKTKDCAFNCDAVRMPYSQKLLVHVRQDAEGRKYYQDGHVSGGKTYLNPLGQLPWDWWTDIPSTVFSHGRDYTGYWGQKPILLMERIVKASSNVGDTVLDPFCGSGTTLVAAKRLGRHYIGIDDSDMAVAISEARLEEI